MSFVLLITMVVLSIYSWSVGYRGGLTSMEKEESTKKAKIKKRGQKI